MNGNQQQPIQAQPVQQASVPPVRPGGGKKWLLIGGGIGLVVILVIGGIVLFRSRAPEPIIPAVREASTEDKAAFIRQQCANDPNPEGCVNMGLADLAGKEGDVMACEGLTGDARDVCVQKVAFGSSNAELCGLLSRDSLKSGCADSIALNIAITSNDRSACAAVSEQLREDCEQYFESNLSADECTAEGRDAVLCEARRITEEAIAANNPDLCDTIEDEGEFYRCKDLVVITDRDFDGLQAYEEKKAGTSDTNPDTDGDGLSDYDEVKRYRSDPTNPDTDGDGFSDGAEVSNGYSPIGPGTL